MNIFLPWIVSAPTIQVYEVKVKGHSKQGQIQKRIVSAETIRGNTVLKKIFYNHDGSTIIVPFNIFQKKDKLDPHETFYKFAFMGLFLMICIMFVFGTFLGGSNLGDSGYDIENEVTTAQPSTTTSKILYFLQSVI